LDKEEGPFSLVTLPELGLSNKEIPLKENVGGEEDGEQEEGGNQSCLGITTRDLVFEGISINCTFLYN
jgi:hypothetical protein